MNREYGNVIFYEKPADDFRAALPVGNGRIGAMVFGGLTKEVITLSDATLWSGSDSYEYPDDVYKVLPEIQQLVLKGEYQKAQELYLDKFIAFRPLPMDGANSGSLPYGCLQTLGKLELSFFQLASGCFQEWYPYRMVRSLDMRDGIAGLEHISTTAYWEANAPGTVREPIRYKRQVLASRDHECLAIKLDASETGRISFNLTLNRTERFHLQTIGDDMLLMSGQLDDGHGGGGVKYACLAKVIVKGGSVKADSDTVLLVRGADEALILITTATDMKSFGSRNTDDPVKAVREDMQKASQAGWERIREDHIRSHRSYYDRMSLQLNEIDEKTERLPVDERLRRVGEGKKDDGLVTLMFNYGRYLMISGACENGMPLAIEGIWCREIQSPFNGDYHINAQQEAYWNAECCNLPEFHKPYLRMTKALVKNGSDVARKFYNARGWVAHTITNPWSYALPGGETNWGATIVGGAWLCVHLWEHYLYGKDREYLEWAYPVIKGCAEFLLDRLITDPETGCKVLFPGNTPENYFLDEEGRDVAIDLGTAYDMGITRYIFRALMTAASLLDTDADLAEEIRSAYEELAPFRVGSDGRFMEWQREHKEAKPYHRHISPLWCIYPGDEKISAEETPQLAQGALKLIDARTYTGQTWAMMWRCAVFARLHEGDRITEVFDKILWNGITENLFCHVYFTKEDERAPESDLQTPFDRQSIFEIDGNMGFSAVVVEMLMQSHRKEDDLTVIELLPALPRRWEKGSVAGMRARGNFLVDLEWDDHQLKKAVIRRRGDASCFIRYGSTQIRTDFEDRDEIVLTPEQMKTLTDTSETESSKK